MSDNQQNAADDMKETADSSAQNATGAPGDTASSTAKSTVDQVVEGVERASGQVADSARTIWESDQRKDIQDSVVKGLSGVALTIEEQVKKIADNPETQKFVGKMEAATGRIVEDVTANKAFQDVAEAVMKGLNAAAASIEKWLGQQRSVTIPADAGSSETPATPADDAQTIEIQRED